jgi:type II secretory pathway component PulJ
MATPARSTSPDRGFTLAEAILAMFLFSIVFVLTAQVLNNAHRILRHQRYKTAAQQGIQMALSRISSELREAIGIQQLGTGVLEFYKADASLSRYASLANFNARLNVRYELQNGQLYRRVMPGGQAQLIAEELYGFSSTQLANNNVQVQLTFRDPKLVRTYDVQVAVPSAW